MEDMMASVVCLGVWTWFKVKVGLQFRFWFGSGAGEGISMDVFTEASKNPFYIIFSDVIRAAILSNKWVLLHNYSKQPYFTLEELLTDLFF